MCFEISPRKVAKRDPWQVREHKQGSGYPEASLDFQGKSKITDKRQIFVSTIDRLLPYGLRQGRISPKIPDFDGIILRY